MNHDRFDAVTRVTAAGVSRRETLRSVGAMVAGVAALPIAGAAAQTSESQTSNNDRCDKAERKCTKIGKRLCNGDAGCNRSFKKCCKKCFSDRFLRCLRNEGAA